MKKIIVLCMIVLGSSLSVFAQEKGRRPQGQKGEDPAKRIEKIAKELNLDETKTKEFQKINTEFMEKMRSEMSTSKEDRAKAREKMESLRKDRDEQIKKMLTEEQYKKYQEIEKKNQKQMQQGRKQGDGKNRGNRPSKDMQMPME